MSGLLWNRLHAYSERLPKIRLAEQATPVFQGAVGMAC
jgi:hypothetical protein